MLAREKMLLKSGLTAMALPDFGTAISHFVRNVFPKWGALPKALSLLLEGFVASIGASLEELAEDIRAILKLTLSLYRIRF
ncbi:MAG: hypothetical protein C0446_11415 [Chitinophaga sp.]|nr:hypothetical protein [Chitinophaga sp.]